MQRDQAKVLGICWVLYGIWRLVLVVGMVLFAPTATVMFGALLSRVADPFTLMHGFHLLYYTAILLSGVCGVLGIIVGLALLNSENSSRNRAIAVALLSLPDLPVGVMLGAYTLFAYAGVSERRVE